MDLWCIDDREGQGAGRDYSDELVPPELGIDRLRRLATDELVLRGTSVRTESHS
jgi:hypothetical protein